MASTWAAGTHIYIPRITLVKRGQGNYSLNTYTKAEVSYYLDVLEPILPIDQLGWEDVTGLYNENASVMRHRSIRCLKRLLYWVRSPLLQLSSNIRLC